MENIIDTQNNYYFTSNLLEGNEWPGQVLRETTRQLKYWGWKIITGLPLWPRGGGEDEEEEEVWSSLEAVRFDSWVTRLIL